MRYVFWMLVLLLLVAHQDYWQWDHNEIVLGFVPYTLAYNIGISLATVVVWITVCIFFWPNELDDIQLEQQNTKHTGGRV